MSAYIFGISRDKHITPYRERLGWLTCNTRRLYFTSIVMYKILRLRQPDYLTSNFVRYIPKETAIGELITRELTIPELEKWHCDFSFQVQGIKSWNSFPSQIRFLPSLNSFKTGLFEYLRISNHTYYTYDDSVF